MLNIKVLVTLGLMLPSIWSHGIWGEGVHNTEGISQPAENTVVKINWGPVWDDIDGSNEFVLRRSDEEDQCLAPNTKGLQNLFKESIKLLPLQGIKEIVDSYANDAEVKALTKFVKSTEYQEHVKAIRNSEEYMILKAYVCHVLHIDLADLRDYITSQVIRSSSHTRGIKGLLNKIQSIVPQQKLRDLYSSLMKSDEELVKAVAHLKSEEFQQMLMNLRNNVPASKELRQKLQAIGVPLDGIRGVVGSAVGWTLDLDVVA